MSIKTIEISNFYAYCKMPLLLIILTKRKIGQRCSVKAAEKLKNNEFHGKVITTVINNEIVWVSCKEALENDLKECDSPTYTSYEIKEIKESLRINKNFDDLLNKYASLIEKVKDKDLFNDSLIETGNDIYDDLKALRALNSSENSQEDYDSIPL